MFTIGIVGMAIFSILLFYIGTTLMRDGGGGSDMGQMMALCFGYVCIFASIIMTIITALVYFGR